jgi:cytoskeletal protein CcmA (bactofilin family)
LKGSMNPADSKREENAPWGHFFSKGERAVSLIGEEILATGTIFFKEGTVRLDGHLEGKIIGQGMLIIGEKGSLQGEVQVGELLLFGRLEGGVDVSGLTHIAPTGRLCGRVHSHHLVIEAGGIFDGESETAPREEGPAAAQQRA